VGVRRRPAAVTAAARGSGEQGARGGQCATLGGSTGPRVRVGRLAGGESERHCKFTSGGGNGGLRWSGARRGRMAALK
jgi:hypothetical protein